MRRRVRRVRLVLLVLMLVRRVRRMRWVRGVRRLGRVRHPPPVLPAVAAAARLALLIVAAHCHTRRVIEAREHAPRLTAVLTYLLPMCPLRPLYANDIAQVRRPHSSSRRFKRSLRRASTRVRDREAYVCVKKNVTHIRNTHASKSENDLIKPSNLSPSHNENTKV